MCVCYNRERSEQKISLPIDFSPKTVKRGMTGLPPGILDSAVYKFSLFVNVE